MNDSFVSLFFFNDFSLSLFYTFPSTCPPAKPILQEHPSEYPRVSKKQSDREKREEAGGEGEGEQ